MAYLLLGILVLGLLTAGMAWLCNPTKQNNGQPNNEPTPPVPSDCCGQHQLCERDSLLAAVSRQIVYYDDDELDAYRGLDATTYPEKALNEFREVLYTLHETDVAGWVRSLQLRGIALPDSLKDEVFMIVGERRT